MKSDIKLRDGWYYLKGFAGSYEGAINKIKSMKHRKRYFILKDEEKGYYGIYLKGKRI